MSLLVNHADERTTNMFDRKQYEDYLKYYEDGQDDTLYESDTLRNEAIADQLGEFSDDELEEDTE